MGGLHRFFGAVISQSPQQRHAFGRSESQIKPVDTALRKPASGSAVRRDAVVEPTLRQVRISRTPVNRPPVQTNQLNSAGGVASDQPRRYTSVAFGVVLP